MMYTPINIYSEGVLKIILGSDCPIKEDGHFDYDRALAMCNLKSLFSRRQKKTLDFGIKCIKHPTLKKLFPLNPAIIEDPHPVRNREQFAVNHTRTMAYKNSAIPSIQRRLNKKFPNMPLI